MAYQVACTVNSTTELNAAEEQSCVRLNWKAAGVYVMEGWFRV